MAAITSREAAYVADETDVLEESGVRRRPVDTCEMDPVIVGDGPADARVQSFLDGVETRRQRSNRAGWVVLGVGALVAGVAYLTSIGVVGPDARTAAASVGRLFAGYFVANK